VKPKILVVDDEPSILDNIQYALEADGMETLRLTEGLPALPLLARERIDLIVLDVGLPDISGSSSARRSARRTRRRSSSSPPARARSTASWASRSAPTTT